MKANTIKSTALTAVLVATCVWGTGCGTIITSGDRRIPISSSPTAATVTVYDMNRRVVASGVTPTEIKLKKGAGFFKGADYRLVIEKPGFQTKELEIRHDVNGWYLGNLILGGALGLLVVDPLTGGMWVLKPDKIDVALTAVSARVTKPGLPIVTFNELTPAQRQHLVPLDPSANGFSPALHH